MGTRSYAQVAPTADTIALNAYIFGYGGHSLVTPHTALKQAWWTEERIQAKVNQAFIVSRLTKKEIGYLYRPLAFGEGLTNDTYLDWILQRARRLFLILAEVGVPDQIFGCIDDSWCDDDLPVSSENIPRLELADQNDEALNKKFYDAQFFYLLRELDQGFHIDYGPNEHIPMEHVNTLPPAVTLQAWDRIHFPGRPSEIYMRRKYSVTGEESGRNHRRSFLADVQKAKQMKHEHIVSIWASYAAGNFAFVLSDFVGEHTLGSFIDHRMPTQYKRLEPCKRPTLLCEWMHCLADALAFIHHNGMAHIAIRPSNILIDEKNRIAFADIGSLRTFQRGKKHDKTEIYNYAAPESHLSSEATLSLSSPRSITSALIRLRRPSAADGSSSSSSAGSMSTRSSIFSDIPAFPKVPTANEQSDIMGKRGNSLSAMDTIPNIPTLNERPDSISTISGLGSPLQRLPSSSLNFSRHLDVRHTSPTAVANSQIADIFSLGCVFLDIISFMVKGRNVDFVKFRTTKVTSDAKRTRQDTSFHTAPERIDAWMALLGNHSKSRAAQPYNGVSELLQLVREMMTHSPLMRPSAVVVRDRLRRTLTGICGMHGLCCTDRVWNE